ncbi:hypothetical protein J437_LFUL012750 [Ladona fulva]|uniref:Uncharacterized protein n=1 Tax=Ladona fulva TaxID=123851 RepID=A0A8K0KS12_LADFU|nr:hypothetical protein J437_LFUL012750 [Ladona fulva]
MAPRRKCKFNDNLQKEFEFIKKVKPEDEHEVRCTVCGTPYSVAHFSGRTDITDHISSKKHERALNVASSSQKLLPFFKRQEIRESDFVLAAKEASFSYHSVMHGHSFRSMDCTSRLIKAMYEKRFSCARTKTEAIVFYVLYPFMEEEVEADLNEFDYVV